MYVVFGYEIVDSEEIKEHINNEKKFKVLTDMSKATKREDILAYNISIDVNILDEIIKERNETNSEDDLFDIYMNLADTLAMELGVHMPKEHRLSARAYKLDPSDNDVKLILVSCHYEISEPKLNDVMKRLLKQVG